MRIILSGRAWTPRERLLGGLALVTTVTLYLKMAHLNLTLHLSYQFLQGRWFPLVGYLQGSVHIISIPATEQSKLPGSTIGSTTLNCTGPNLWCVWPTKGVP